MKNDEHVDEHHHWIITPTGERLLIGVRQDVFETLPTGERRYLRHTTAMLDASGRTIDPERSRLVPCHRCGTYPLVEQATRTCAACEAIICLGCAVRVQGPDEDEQYLCRPCAQQARRQARWRFFLSFQ